MAGIDKLKPNLSARWIATNTVKKTKALPSYAFSLALYSDILCCLYTNRMD